MISTTRRQFLAASAALPLPAQTKRPNVILIITDDQGYGDLSIHGNDKLQTPNIDSIAKEGVQFTQFQVCPVCSPTRSSLMTGRYNYRTGIVDTFLGRSMMHNDEVTLAEMLGAAGYRTGIFGKWHMGDNYPMRAIDQGFHEALVLKGGGIGQPADPPGGSSYFDPLLQHNGKQERKKGYCTDVYFDAAMEFLDANRSRPFFIYVATNAPHDPLEVAESWVEPYRKLGLKDATAKVYAMVKNIDNNVGRLLAKLKAAGLERDTILVFMTDNGPQHDRYNAGMRGRKATVYQGGIRVPCFVRWPAVARAGRKVDRIAAHIDWFPTLAEACGGKLPADRKIDGRSLLALLRGEQPNWPDRTLFTQWHRGDVPELFRDCAARTQRWKLVNGKELYDIENDPAESADVAARHPGVAARLRKETEAWYKDVSATRGYDPPRIYLGAPQENPVVLTRQDWRGPRAGWDAGSIGYWEVDVRSRGRYDVTLDFAAAKEAGEAALSLGAIRLTEKVAAGTAQCKFRNVEMTPGPGRLEPLLRFGAKDLGVQYVTIAKL